MNIIYPNYFINLFLQSTLLLKKKKRKNQPLSAGFTKFLVLNTNLHDAILDQLGFGQLVIQLAKQ